METTLRIHFVRRSFAVSDPATKEALHDVPLFPEFVALNNWNIRCLARAQFCDACMGLCFKKHELATQMLEAIEWSRPS
jgi:IS5 family transposase